MKKHRGNDVEDCGPAEKWIHQVEQQTGLHFNEEQRLKFAAFEHCGRIRELLLIELLKLLKSSVPSAGPSTARRAPRPSSRRSESNTPSHPSHPEVLHALDILPDSLRLRKNMLQDCLVLLPEDDPLGDRVSQMLDLLVLHEQLQQELPALRIKP